MISAGGVDGLDMFKSGRDRVRVFTPSCIVIREIESLDAVVFC